MKRDFRAEELLHCSDVLAGRREGRGRLGIRRAVPGGSAADRHVVARWYSHGNLKKAAEWVDLIHNGKKPPPGVDTLLSSSGPLPADLAVVAAAVRDLQQARHDADYDPAYDATKRRTLGHIDQARAAVAAAQRLHTTPGPSYARFLLLALGGPSMVKNN